MIQNETGNEITAPNVAGTTQGQLDKNNNISLPEFFRDDKV